MPSGSCPTTIFLGHCFFQYQIRQTGSHLRMRAVRPIAISFAVAITTFLIAAMPPRHAAAQTSMGSPDPVPPPAPSTPAPAPYIPPPLAPAPPAPSQPNPSTDITWAAIGFTADGSFSTTWKMPSQAEAEARSAKGCAQFGRGRCEVVSFSGQQCGALATFIGSYRRRRWSLSFTAGGATYPEAQNAALVRCNADERSQGRCQSRTAVCADGR
jgi:Domain of unknown function (DUF4189)